MLILRDRRFDAGETVVMAIINRTTDSFYDRGATWTDDAALDRADAVVAAGADMVDIGGVKAAPGAEVAVDEEIRRVAAFVATVRARHPDVIISVDTYRAEVARAVASGAPTSSTTPGVVGTRAWRRWPRSSAWVSCAPTRAA